MSINMHVRWCAGKLGLVSGHYVPEYRTHIIDSIALCAIYQNINRRLDNT